MYKKIAGLGLVTLCFVFGGTSSVHAADAISQGLIGNWSFNEGDGGEVTDSVSGSKAKFIGSMWSDGVARKAGVFNGKNSYVYISDSTEFSANKFSVSAWIKMNTWVLYAPILNRRDKPDSGGFTIQQSGTVGELAFNIFLVNKPRTTFRVPGWVTDKWYHVVATYDGKTQRLYRDGVEIASQYAPGNVSNPVNAHMEIGRTASGTSYFDGMIDEVRMYNRALTATEVQHLYRTNALDVPDKKPNIIVIMTDDQDNVDSMPYMKNVNELLASNGVTFKNSYVAFSQCCPSRAGLLTGQYAHNNGVRGNTPVGIQDGGYDKLVATENNTLPVWLQNAGYTTAMIGKYLNGIERFMPAIPKGWNHWIALDTYGYYDYKLNENGVMHSYGSSTFEYLTDVLSDKATGYITSQAGSSQPFFLWLNPLAPHSGYPNVSTPEPAPRHKYTLDSLELPRPPSFNETNVTDKPRFVSQGMSLLNQSEIDLVTENYRRRKESLLAVDDMVSKVVSALKATGKYENTIIIFTSDNGFFAGEHRKQLGKLLVYEESLRVPLIISGPLIPKRQTRSQLVLNLDLTPTILDLAKATTGRTLDGKSLSGLLTDSNTPWRTAFLVEGMDQNNAMAFVGRYNAIHTNKFVLANHTSDVYGSENEFYDFIRDKYQLTNNIGNPIYASAIRSLQTSLDKIKTCAGDSCWISSSQSAYLSKNNSNRTRELKYLQSNQMLASAMRSTSKSLKSALTYTKYSPEMVKALYSVKPFSTSTIQLGARGNDVKILQEYLAFQTNLFPSMAIDGIFSTSTLEAVVRFQERYITQGKDKAISLWQGNVVDYITIDKLNEAYRNDMVREYYDDMQ